MMIITRQEAKARGLKRYYTGVPCSRGHRSERRVADKKCLKCTKEDLETYKQTDKYKNRMKEWSYETNLAAKVECLSHYSHREYPVCSSSDCCAPGGVTDIRILDLDHINGGGE
jgi:hypothetical protein